LGEFDIDTGAGIVKHVTEWAIVECGGHAQAATRADVVQNVCTRDR
jgi:hypothetical protein